MIAVKVRSASDGKWVVWLGVNMACIRRDVELMRGYDLGTLHPIPLADVAGMDGYADGAEVVLRCESQCGEDAPYIAGATAYYLGPLMAYDAHREPA